ncbi:MAG: sigma-70 family RNA polymerase sigma factor [Syntrophobacteraceae bacterium]
MGAVSTGDIAAFDEIVHRYRDLAWRVAFRFLGDSMESEDAAQDAFLRILDAASRYRPTASFRTYFYRVLINCCIDRTRKRHSTTTGNIPDVADPSLSPSEVFIERERAAHVRTALDALPPNQKAAMILKHYEGLRYVEIARILTVSPKAVERLISRARSSLQTRLAHLKTD